MNSYSSFRIAPWIFKPILQFAEDRGVSKATLLNSIGVQEKELYSSEQPVDYIILDQLLLQLAKKLSNPSFGVELGNSKNMLSGHLLDYLVHSCKTVFDAVKEIAEYNILLSNFLFARLDTATGSFVVQFPAEQQWVSRFPVSSRILRDCVTTFIFKLVSELSGKKVQPSAIFMHNDKLVNTGQALNGAVFPVLPRYCEEGDFLVYPPGCDCPIITSNGMVHDILKKHILELSTISEFNKKFSQRIKWQLIGMEMNVLSVGIEEIAASNHLSVRKLQQLLKAEGTSFREICNEVKLQVIKKHISATGHSIKESADLLGYANASALSTFFKKTTGVAPSKFDKSHD